MVAEDGGLTRDEANIYKVLSDGLWHSKKELHTCLWDHEQSHFPSALQVRISQLRKKLIRQGLDVFAKFYTGETGSEYGYVMARLIGKNR